MGLRRTEWIVIEFFEIWCRKCIKFLGEPERMPNPSGAITESHHTSGLLHAAFLFTKPRSALFICLSVPSMWCAVRRNMQKRLRSGKFFGKLRLKNSYYALFAISPSGWNFLWKNGYLRAMPTTGLMDQPYFHWFQFTFLTKLESNTRNQELAVPCTNG